MVNPRAQQPDLPDAQWIALLGHAPDVLAQSRHEVDQQTLGALARCDSRPQIAAFERHRLLVEAKAGFVFVGPMAAIAVLGEDRLDVFGEIHLARSGGWQFGDIDLGSVTGGWNGKDREREDKQRRSEGAKKRDAGGSPSLRVLASSLFKCGFQRGLHNDDT